MRRRVRPLALALFLVLCGGLAPVGLAPIDHVRADDVPADPETAQAGPSAEEARIAELLNRLERVENELLQLKVDRGQPVPAGQQKLLTLIESPFLGSTSYGSPSGVRYLAARLVFVNLTNDEVTVEPPKFTLEVDGKPIPYKEVPNNIQYYNFQIGNQSHQLKTMAPQAKLVLRPGGSGSTPIIFLDLPDGTKIPHMELVVPLGEKEVARVDVNRNALDSLAMSVERIGPSRSLGLVTIGGSFNTINAGALEEALGHLTAQRVARVVIRWSDSAGPLDNMVWNWLQQAAAYAGRQEMQNQQLPILPAAIRELHLANVPNENARRRSSYGNFSTEGRIHDTDAEAITAALRSAYEVLDREQLLADVKTGTPMIRAAALEGGGGRLDSAQLPLLIGLSNDENADVQRAAIGALRHFGEPEAIATLVALVRKNAKPTGRPAIESLARSRFRAAHEALLAVLETDPPKGKIEIVKVLAQYPRPVWADTIYEFVDSGDTTVATAALNALVQIGHPRLFDVLKRHLEGGNKAMENQAFGVLVGRTDPDSEELAMEYTLAKLKHSPPDQNMLNLLNRTKDPQAIPLLLQYFDSSSNNRSSIINTLAQIGDEVVADAFVAKFDQLEQGERQNVLRALQQMRSPAFRELAGKALATTDSSLISVACEGLRLEAGPEAVEMLAEALVKTQNTSAMSYISNTLAQLATPEAKRALVEARESGNENKRNYAGNALRNMYQRSPGYQYVYQARSLVSDKKFKEAIKQFDVALQLDPDLPEALAERGSAHLNLDHVTEARDDYRKALALDAWNPHAITGMGIVMARDGATEEAVKFVEDQKQKAPNDAVFSYNVACVYGRAIESLKKAEKPDEEQITKYRNAAIAQLKQSKQQGFGDLEWMGKDPDLASLRDDPDFVEIHSPTKTETEEKTDEGEADEAVPAAGVLKQKRAVQRAVVLPNGANRVRVEVRATGE